MLKRLIIMLLALSCLFSFAACGEDEMKDNEKQDPSINTDEEEQDPSINTDEEEQDPSINTDEEEQNIKISSLVGTWKETEGKLAPAVYYLVVITTDNIKIISNWMNGGVDLYWDGSYKDPEEPVSEYTFESIEKEIQVGYNEPRKRQIVYRDGMIILKRLYGEYEAGGSYEAHNDSNLMVYLHKID